MPGFKEVKQAHPDLRGQDLMRTIAKMWHESEEKVESLTSKRAAKAATK